MATRRNEMGSQIFVEREDREAVFAVISASQSITIEALLDHLPWMRWGHLFSILGECLQEGSVILCQKEFQFEVRVINSSQNGSDERCSDRSCSVKLGRSADRYLTRS
jgi:hypothetical protein